MRVLDLFSGIGGFSLGLHNAGGFETVAFCEIDKFCQKVLRKNFKDVPILSDISKIGYFNNNLWEHSISYDWYEGKIDVICGGFPCQDISVAGKQKGITNETRSGLWNEYKRIIKEVKPRWVIIENVRNLLNNGLAIVLKDLHEIGYNAEWQVISARSVGACHLRERLWIVAYPNTTRFQSAWAKQQTTRTSGCANSSLCNKTRNASNSDNFRFWPTFTTEEEKLKWWAEATASFRNWWQIESSICRVDDGLSDRLDKERANRIKSLGNSIVPCIVELIGKRIIEVEENL